MDERSELVPSQPFLTQYGGLRSPSASAVPTHRAYRFSVAPPHSGIVRGGRLPLDEDSWNGTRLAAFLGLFR
jgi:hypothetical protein